MSEDIREDFVAAVMLLADIRAAVGDPHGRLMQDELVARCAEMHDRLVRAEKILSKLTSNYLLHALNEATPGEQLGDQVVDYWRDSSISPAMNSGENRPAGQGESRR